MSRALLLSGGLDSIALAYWQKPDRAFTVDYGQASAAGEIRAATTVSRLLGISHEVLRADCSSLGSGDLLNRPPDPRAPATEWWPFRNQMLVTFAAMRAVALGVGEIMVGSVATDGFHLDGTAEFYGRLDALLTYQEGNIRVSAPAIALTSVELIRRSGAGPDLLACGHSCHTAPFACGQCRGCEKHRDVFRELGYEPY